MCIRQVTGLKKGRDRASRWISSDALCCYTCSIGSTYEKKKNLWNASRRYFQMSFVAKQSQQGKTVPIIYRLQRWFFAASIVLGMAATLVMVATNPGYYGLQNGEVAFVAAYATANAVIVQVHLIAMVITVYLLPLGLLVMAWLAMRRSPWLASIGAFIVLIGLFPLAAFAGIEALNYDIARMGSNALLITMAQQFNSDGVMSYYNIVNVPGIVLGPTLIGIALWRARAIPVWAALLITFSRLFVFIYPAVAFLPAIYVQLPSCIYCSLLVVFLPLSWC
jgi:hypothetical protein